VAPRGDGDRGRDAIVTNVPADENPTARRMRAAIALCALLIASPARAQALSSSTLTAEPVRDAALTGRSVLFDAKGAADARARQRPQYVESIVVEGRDSDGRRPKMKPLEQRFADVLLAPPPAAAAGLRMLDTTPCMSMPSTWNVLGSSFAPLTGCP
jgi:hypothetical protein